jgi:hypothetical protein
MSGEKSFSVVTFRVVAGWLAGLVISGGGFGIIGNIIVGIIGSFRRLAKTKFPVSGKFSCSSDFYLFCFRSCQYVVVSFDGFLESTNLKKLKFNSFSIDFFLIILYFILNFHR